MFSHFEEKRAAQRCKPVSGECGKVKIDIEECFQDALLRSFVFPKARVKMAAHGQNCMQM